MKMPFRKLFLEYQTQRIHHWCSMETEKSVLEGSPGVGRNTFLSSPHLCVIIVFICDLFVSRNDPLMS